MECLLELCFVLSVYMSGGLGLQSTVDYNDIDRTNSYGPRVGEVSLVVELNNGLYFEAKHISGIDTTEHDYGLNAIMIGAKIYLFKGNK